MIDIVRYFLIVVAIGCSLYGALMQADAYYGNQEIVNQESIR